MSFCQTSDSETGNSSSDWNCSDDEQTTTGQQIYSTTVHSTKSEATQRINNTQEDANKHSAPQHRKKNRKGVLLTRPHLRLKNINSLL